MLEDRWSETLAKARKMKLRRLNPPPKCTDEEYSEILLKSKE